MCVGSALIWGMIAEFLFVGTLRSCQIRGRHVQNTDGRTYAHTEVHTRVGGAFSMVGRS